MPLELMPTLRVDDPPRPGRPWEFVNVDTADPDEEEDDEDEDLEEDEDEELDDDEDEEDDE